MNSQTRSDLALRGSVMYKESYEEGQLLKDTWRVVPLVTSGR